MGFVKTSAAILLLYGTAAKADCPPDCPFRLGTDLYFTTVTDAGSQTTHFVGDWLITDISTDGGRATVSAKLVTPILSTDPGNEKLGIEGIVHVELPAGGTGFDFGIRYPERSIRDMGYDYFTHPKFFVDLPKLGPFRVRPLAEVFEDQEYSVKMSYSFEGPPLPPGGFPPAVIDTFNLTFSIMPVPEAPQWAMTIVGFATLGAICRRRAAPDRHLALRPAGSA